MHRIFPHSVFSSVRCLQSWNNLNNKLFSKHYVGAQWDDGQSGEALLTKGAYMKLA